MAYKLLQTGPPYYGNPMSELQKLTEIVAYLEKQRSEFKHPLLDAAIDLLKENSSIAANSPQAQEQRRQVTVLFADISGFTAMSEKMDAEDVHGFIQALWNKLDRIVLTHGGKIDKHIGDAIMAIWGVDSTREDDPVRAVRAALAMQHEIQQWQHELHELAILQPTETFSIRIGINTGPVILGRVGTMGEFTAMGDTVNTASRLEKSAPAGNILIARSTYLHVRGLFDLREQAPIQAKGKSRPLKTYLVQREKPHSFRTEQRGIQGISTPMIGRAREFETLQQRYYNMLLEEKQYMMIISGEAGLGKTRLIYEFDSWIESLSWKTSSLKARARQGFESQPYYLLAELIRSYFDISYSDHAELAREKIAVKISQEFGSTEQRQRYVKICEQAVGLESIDEQNAHRNTSRFNSADTNAAPEFNNPRSVNIGPQLLPLLLEFIHEISQIEPTVILLEDIHWADSTSLQFIHQLHTESSEQLLMIVATARPDYFKRYPQWSQLDPARYENLKLQPLSEKDSRELIKSILYRAERIPEQLFTNIIDRSEGYPYHIEEFIKMMIADNIIIEGKTKWSIRRDKLENARVPTTLINILQARIDNLPPHVRKVLRCASILGQIFWDDGIAHILQDANENDRKIVADAINFLLENRLISERPSTTVDSREFIFNNSLLHQVTYEGILKRQRRTYHMAAGKWLIEQADKEQTIDSTVQPEPTPTPNGTTVDIPALLQLENRQISAMR